jgi:Protein of unknown function (DUF3108)
MISLNAMKVMMLKLTQILLLSVLSASLIAHAAAEKSKPEIAKPKRIQLEYDLTRNGKLFAKVKESFTQNGKTYSIQSVTKGIGVYALMGERVSTSTGAVTKAGLKPTRFELRQGKSAKKTLIADFNWAKNTLVMQVKGETKTEKLDAGTQDLASYVYQFMYAPPKANEVKVSLTTGKRLNQYQYKVMERSEKVDAANKTFKTLHISNQASAGDDIKQLWLAEEQFYLPVRYTLEEDGDKFEQTLTKTHVE